MAYLQKILVSLFVLVGLLAGSQALQAASWVSIPPPLTATWYGIAVWDESNAVIVGESEGGVVYKSINNGASWSSKISQSNPGVYDVAKVPGTLAAYAVGRHASDSAFMLYSANKGTGWEILVPTGVSPFADLYGVSFASSTTGYVVGSSGLIYKTTDASNWTQQASGVTTTLRDVDFIDANHGWAVGDNNVVVRTTNGGANWTSVSPGVTANFFGVDFVNATTGWVVGSNGTILVTTNGGTTWTIKSPEGAGASVTFRSVAFLDANRGMFVGSGGNVFVTSDGGTTIAKESFGSNAYLYAAAWVNAGDRWVAGQSSIGHFDAIAPSVGQIGPVSATAGTALTLTASVADTVSPIASCNLFVDGADKGSMVVAGGTASFAYTFTNAGSANAYVRCTDTAGNVASGTPVAMSVNAATQGGSGGPYQSPSGLVPGDLIRGTVLSPYGGYPVFYYTSDRKKALFPNEVTYKTWYTDFSTVKVLSQSELEAISSADKNVTVRPGHATVRFENENGLYVVDPGAIIRAVTSSQATGIYGSNYTTLYIEVAFRANYHTGTPVSAASPYNATAALAASTALSVEMAR